MPADECVDEKAFDAMIEHLLEQRGSVALISLISLRTFYLQQLNSFGYKATIDFVHATKLRHRIIERLPDIKLIEKNRIWYLFFNEDAHHALLNCSASDINLLSKAATLLLKDILNKKQKFTGSFSSSSEADSVTDSLLVFMRMVLDGPTPGKIDVPSSSDKIALSLSELIMFNCVGKRSSSSRKLRHNQERETPLPLILAMKIHMKTGQKTLVDTLAERGLCTSYSRTNQIACDLANIAITIWEEGVVFPLQAEKGVFTTGGMDNIDYNPSSATSQITLHGTGSNTCDGWRSASFHFSQASSVEPPQFRNFRGKVCGYAGCTAYREVAVGSLWGLVDPVNKDNRVLLFVDDVINNVRKISSFGRELYNKFLNERVFDQKVPFNETLKEVNLRLFKDVLKSKSKSTKATISALKDEHSQASHLLLAAQGGRHISDDLFGHESSKFPPALTKDGEIDHSTKSEILDCLCVQEK
ncbi:hypothetical protein CAPTEDRAFT_216554 [Capitella teleta]|uniref:Uncharacterized protein n=1 Tax=Capitella teleta TaxID=283909 RepID=R7UGU6_CAPTE|nr:hypothetical protein CAPTEDRAFT_216554 [Capitella teleta]|eukprot:ELU05323.1 hypothetical protein CAPTEDRAFT_216554 [Capitella teleta]